MTKHGFSKSPLRLVGKKICVAGANGMVGQAVVKSLRSEDGIVLPLTRDEADLRDQRAVQDWFTVHKPDIVILAAARVGGIHANATYPAEFLYDNLMIEANIIHAAYQAGVEKLVFLGSSCIYPRNAPQPIQPETLLSAPLETTNEAYAVAKIAGIKLCQAYRVQYGCDFISLMPCNLYGPGDHYDMQDSHVIPALMMKMHQARETHVPRVELWGTGTPLREFLYVEDLAEGILHAMKYYSDPTPLNIGSGAEVSIADLAKMIAEVVGYKGEIEFNPEYPDGMPRKVLDSAIIRAHGWNARMTLEEGLSVVYEDFCSRAERPDAA